MKIGPTLNNVHFLNLNGKGAVARDDARADKDSENGRDQYTRQQKKDDEKEGTPEERKQKFEDALQSFQEDPQAQAAGLSAETEGSGPGLRVVVKNGEGGVIRQFTGEEFMKLRDAVSNAGNKGPGRGKLLDRKA